MKYAKLTISIASVCATAGILGITPPAKADYVRIMSRAVCPGDIPIVKGNVGHAAIAFYDASGNLLGTKAMWPDGVKESIEEDKKMARGEGCGLRTRTAVVSASRRKWIWDQVATRGGTNCQKYTIIGKVQLSDQFCSCVNFATRVWRQVTSDWERWQFQSTPKLLGDKIQSANRGQMHGMFDNGKEWK